MKVFFMAKERKKRTPSAPADETKSAKFSRLASTRVSKAVKAIRNIGNLSGRSYEYTGGQTAAILKYLTDAVAEVQARYAAPQSGPSEPEIKI